MARMADERFCPEKKMSIVFELNFCRSKISDDNDFRHADDIKFLKVLIDPRRKCGINRLHRQSINRW